MYFGDLTLTDIDTYLEQSRHLAQLMRGDYAPIDTYLRRQYPTTDLQRRSIPFTERYVAELAGLYERRTRRTWLTEGRAAAKMATVYEASAIDDAMAEIEQSAWVQNSVFAVVLPRGLGRVQVVPVEPYMVADVEVDDALLAADPGAWRRALLRLPSETHHGQIISGEVELTRTHAWRQVGDGRRGIYRADGTHPFGRVPIVAIHRRPPLRGQWHAPTNEAVLNLQVALSLQTADDENTIKHTAFPQRVIEGSTPDQMVETLQVGADKVLALRASGNPDAPPPRLSIVQGQVPVAELVSHTEHKIRMYCSMLGIDSTSFIRTNTAVTASARLFAHQDRQKQRSKIKPRLRRFERDLAQLIAAWLTESETVPIPADIDVAVTWAEHTISPDPQRDAAAHAQRIDLGLDSPASIKARELGVTLAEAQEIVRRNRELTRELEAPPEPPPAAPPAEPDPPSDAAGDPADDADARDEAQP